MPSAPLATSTQSKNRQRSKPSSVKKATDAECKENNIQPGVDESFVHAETVAVDIAEPAILVEPIFPATPAIKIPLEDLIGNTEDAFNCAPSAVTPKDHVLWQNGPRSSGSSVYPADTQRGQKRNHSSSPPSPSRWETSQDISDKHTQNRTSRNKSMRTPNHDPSHDLWNRYMKAPLSRHINEVSKLLQIEHLLPSSPQTPNTTGKDSAIRRTVSCGVEWPTSKSKRRKVSVEQNHTRTKGIFAESKNEILAAELPKAPRVGLLVEKIQESLLKRPVQEEGPSSSSPLPDRYSQLTLSPTRQQRSEKDENKNQVVNMEVVEEVINYQENTVLNQPSSEFGDDGLDLEILENYELPNEPQSTNNLPIPSAARSEKLDSDNPENQTDRAKRSMQECLLDQSEIRSQKQRLEEARNLHSDDEFDDGDETFTSALNDLAAQYDLPKVHAVTEAHQFLDGTHSQEFDEDLGDDEGLWNNLLDGDEASGSPENINMAQKSFDNRAIKRYLVVAVTESLCGSHLGTKRPEKLCSIKDERTGLLYLLSLRQSWYETRATKGSYVHVIGHFDRSGQCIVDDANNMVILHPDHLISSTVVGDSFTCTRRAALQDRIKATSAPQKPQVYGHILHELFGEALRIKKWDKSSIQSIINKILPNYIESLYEIGVSIPQAVEYLLSKSPDLAGWAKIFVGENIAKDAAILDRNGALVPTRVNKLIELEEHVWSPMYGLKGNIDATVQSKMQFPGENDVRNLIIPFELKTGKKDNVEAHRAQTALYTLLLSDRYDVNVTSGILYYLETSKSFRIESMRNEIRHMIIERNELACFVHDKLDLPPMIQKPYLCKSCYSQTACLTYHKLIESGNAQTSGVGEKFDEIVGHFKPEHQIFFKKWDDLLTREERDSMKFRRELWTMLSTEREAVGRCFSNVIVEPGSVQETPDSTKINRFQYTFVKHEKRAGFSFTESQITIGEPIVISDERGHFNLASGYVISVRPTRIIVAVDRRLKGTRLKAQGFDSNTNQIFTESAINEIDFNARQSGSMEPESPSFFRIDKDEFANGMATARNNLLRLMEKDLWRARELRQLIIENVPPVFRPLSMGYTLSGPASQQDLNVDQRQAIEKVLSAKDYALVLGMPGTGKTTTIAHIIRALVSQHKSVLLTSYTHTAVDNILLKIKDDDIPILRLGAVTKVHPEVQKFADLAGMQKKTIEELHESWHNSKVVATTCLGINHGIFNARTFDYCIVDEASQITLPVCLGPIRMARTFILVGDHYQLPPLVQNKEAQEGGLNVSLFKLLSDNQPESVVNLEHQYRMAEDIMLLSKELVYNGRLKCGTESVANRLLCIPNIESGLTAHHHSSQVQINLPHSKAICTADSSCWLRQALIPQSRCLFLNTDTLKPTSTTRESVAGSRITNASESTLIAQLVTTLIRSGVPPRSIGVITFYRSQLALLKQDMKSYAGTNAATEIEMHTADKYQGRDKEVIILSCVRNNENNHVGDLLKDWRRVNVAVTRARSKLIIVGSKDTLSGSGIPILQGIVQIMNSKTWIQDLPGNALENHFFECSLSHTQTQIDSKTNGGTSNNHSRQRKEPLQDTSGNASPQKRKSDLKNELGQSILRKPAKVVHGSAVNIENLLDKRPIIRDVINEVGFDS